MTGDQLIRITNDGAEIASTNYWQSDPARKGYFYLSINAGCFRLLVPEAHRAWIGDMLTGREVIVSRGPWPAEGRADGIELLFEDGSDEPFALHLSVEQLDRIPAADNADQPGKPPRWKFAVWTIKGKVLELPCRYRIVPKIPWLKEFEDREGAR